MTGRMETKATKVLLIEDHPGDARLIREALAESRGARIDLECVDRLSSGLRRLADGEIDLLLLDLGLPESQGLDTLDRVRTEAPGVPIIVLTGRNDEVLGAQAVQIGAQDYLVKGDVDSRLLVRAMRYAIERHRLLVKLQAKLLLDELTWRSEERRVGKECRL